MTEAPARRPGPLLTLSSLEWKLALTAVLSAVYAFSFVAVARPAAAPVAATAGVQSAVASVPLTVQRPVVVSSSAAPSTVASAVGSAPAPRASQPRIRTRSS